MKSFYHTTFSDITVRRKGVTIQVNTSEFNDKLGYAQYLLDNQVMTDMTPYMPHVTGTFVNLTRAESASLAGSGLVVAAVPPMGRFLYYGKVMVGEESHSPWAKLGEKKYVINQDLTYQNPLATPFWFETAKANHADGWTDIVQRNI